MSEAMTVETIVEAYWRLNGFWSKLRFPFQTDGGGWSDVDVLAYHPEQKILVISESKVRGPKNDVYAYTRFSREEYGTIFEYDGDNYFTFLKNIRYICSNKVVFNNFRTMVREIIVQLVSNYYIDDEVLPLVQKEIFKKIEKSVPRRVEIEVRLDTTLGIICEIAKLERSKKQGRRYGHSVIDIVRELNRYFNPDIKYAGREKVKDIKQKFRNMLSEAMSR